MGVSYHGYADTRLFSRFHGAILQANASLCMAKRVFRMWKCEEKIVHLHKDKNREPLLCSATRD